MRSGGEGWAGFMPRGAGEMAVGGAAPRATASRQRAVALPCLPVGSQPGQRAWPVGGQSPSFDFSK